MFYEEFWGTLGNDITSYAHNFFQTNRLMNNIDQTNIVLIPKNLDPK